MICVNLFGGLEHPMLVSEIVAELNKKGFKVELVGDINISDDQLKAFANQAFRLRNLARNRTQVVVCDTPLLLSVAYQKICAESKFFTPLVKSEFEKYHNINYFIPSDKQNIMDGMIERVLESYTYKTIPVEEIKDDVMEVVTNERLSRERTEPRRYGSLHDVRRL